MRAFGILTVLYRRQVAEGVMGALLVVLEHPPVRRLAHIIEASAQVLVQDLRAEGPVEAFEIGVLVGLARLAVTDRHAVELGPLHAGFAQELRVVAGAQDLRSEFRGPPLFDAAAQSRGRARGIDLILRTS